MINYKQPESIITGLLDNFDNMDILPDLRFHELYTGNFSELVNNTGAFGVLPLAGTSTGDILALTPLLEKDVTEWPVLKFSHHGGDAAFAATSLSLLPVFSILGEIRPRFIFEDKEIIIKSKEKILILGKLLGEDQRTARCIAFFENLTNTESCTYDEYTLFKDMTAPCWFAAFLETFKKIYMDDNDPLVLWTDFLAQFPYLIPARQLLFGAQVKTDNNAFDNAWKSATAEYYYNNFLFNMTKATSIGISGIDVLDSSNFSLLFEEDPRLEAARYLCQSGKRKEHPAFPAIEKEAEEEPDAELWLRAADQLLEEGELHDSYYACMNAGYWFYLENEDFYREAAESALKVARAMQHPVLEYMLEAVLGE